MAFSSVEYRGDGVTNLFNVPFPYLSKDHISVQVNGDEAGFTWVSSTSIQVTPPPINKSTIFIVRQTPKATLEVRFTDGATLSGDDLQRFQLQLLYGLQEAYDEMSTALRLTDVFDAQENRITNVADPMFDGDAINLRYIRDALIGLNPESAAQATAAAQEAKVAATEAQSVAEAVLLEVANKITILQEKIMQMYVTSVAALSTIDLSTLTNESAIFVRSYHADADWGGGLFYYDTDKLRSTHNGGTIISPTVPWTWTDNGTAFLNGTGETATSSKGVFVRLGTADRGPAAFGARKGTSYDSAPSIKKSLSVFLSASTINHTFDGDGVVYGMKSGFTWTGQCYRKKISNLHVQALSGFTDTALISMLPSLVDHHLNDLRFLDCIFRGGEGQNSAAFCDYLLLLDHATGVWISQCEFLLAKVACLKDLTAIAAVEMYVTDCRISAGAQYNPGAIGIWLTGYDSMIHNNLIRECATHIRCDKGSNFIQGNHIYNYGASRDTFGIVCNDAESMVITGNYIDGVKVLLKNPKDVLLNDNKFLIQDADSWALVRCFVQFATTEANFALTNIISVGNFFRAARGSAPSGYGSNGTSGGGSWDLSAIDGVFIKDNVFDNVTEQTSHPAGFLTVSDATTASVNLAPKSFLGGGLTAVFKFPTKVIGRGSAAPVAMRGSFTGSVLYLLFGATFTGDIVYECTCNASGK